jgi:hypothetical protein
MDAKHLEQQLLTEAGWKSIIPGAFKGKQIKESMKIFSGSKIRGVTENVPVHEDRYEDNNYCVYAFSTKPGGLTQDDVDLLKERTANIDIGLLRYESASAPAGLTPFDPVDASFYSENREIRSLADDLDGIYIYPTAAFGKRAEWPLRKW